MTAVAVLRPAVPAGLATAPSTDREQPARHHTFRQGFDRLWSWIRASRGHGLWIAAWSIVGFAGTAAAPFLTDHPFVVMLLAPRALFVALAADSVAIIPFVLLGTARLAVTDGSYFILGRRFPRMADTAKNQGPSGRLVRARRLIVRWTDAACSWLSTRGFRAGTVLFFRPNGKYLAVAGAYGVSSWVAGLSSVIGTALYLVAFHLGFSLIF